MRAVILREFGDPVIGEFAEPESGPSGDVLTVLAAGVNHLDLAKAAGTFYGELPPLPHVVGSDGVGLTAGGERVYFDACVAPFGAMAERALVDPAHLLPVHDDVGDELAAALGNAGMAAMIALTVHGELSSGEAVAVLGATGSVGRLAIQIARSSGADRVVAVARPSARLEALRGRGATGIAEIGSDDLTSSITAAAGGPVDVVVDMLGGPHAAAGIAALAPGGRYVQVGAKAGPVIEIPAALLRSRLLTLRGTAGVHEPRARRAAAYARLQDLAAAGKLDLDIATFTLEGAIGAWERQRAGAPEKLVILPSAR